MDESGHFPVRIAIETLGCKLNQAESESLSRQFIEAGCLVVSPDHPADIYILNTCTVTHIADRKSRHLLRMAQRLNPSARIVALGCYADSAGKDLTSIDGVDLVVGNRDKSNLIQILLNSGFLNLSQHQSDIRNPDRTRSFIKAQDGCNNFCTYCIVPLVRGREKSLPADEVINQIRRRVQDGYQEVVLTGTEIGRYQYQDTYLTSLLDRILADTGIARLRISSVQPQEITPELIGLWQNPRLCRHFHISLQSGCDSVLQRMGRRYSTQEYQEVVGNIRASIPDVSITTDIIAGFPGETENEFDGSLEFARRMNFARIHVFPYSARSGTRAALMDEQIEPSVKKDRTQKLLSLAKSSLHSFNRSFINREMPVLFEQKTGEYWSGLTDNYIKINIKSDIALTNRFLIVRLVDIKGEEVRGEAVNTTDFAVQ
jgi:threonylcarbamoyladenosine tRNA methylthiotransferase MtaB